MLHMLPQTMMHAMATMTMMMTVMVMVMLMLCHAMTNAKMMINAHTCGLAVQVFPLHGGVVPASMWPSPGQERMAAPGTPKAAAH